jgi:hypothetical protein
MDKNKAWIVDFKIGYRCRALMKVQHDTAKRDEQYTKNNIPVFAEARKWSIAPYDFEQELADVGEGSPG